MIKKMSILAIGNDGKINYVIVKKEEGFLQWLNQLFFESFGGTTTDVMYYESQNVDGKYVQEKREIEKEHDLHEYYDTNDGVRFDLFYGQEKVFIVFNCDAKERKRFMGVLEKYSDFLG